MNEDSNRSYVCPKCSAVLQVIDSRPVQFMGEDTIRRRRRCTKCPHRFTTFEISKSNLVKQVRFAERSKHFADDVVTRAKALLGGLK